MICFYPVHIEQPLNLIWTVLWNCRCNVAGWLAVRTEAPTWVIWFTLFDAPITLSCPRTMTYHGCWLNTKALTKNKKPNSPHRCSETPCFGREFKLFVHPSKDHGANNWITSRKYWILIYVYHTVYIIHLFRKLCFAISFFPFCCQYQTLTRNQSWKIVHFSTKNILLCTVVYVIWYYFFQGEVSWQVAQLAWIWLNSG